ncbi:Gfo/Idh/MocA family protein [Pontiella agarivorans]|uniref:Gfo/Idh/MocA family oxidoreductase n=1 Tax=Pontiella agarivorans TaxID=3038953 RepID=A0ABU5MW80_9BACT|nr:Gfo/Idh/MocA family oxidoreductase [Pontiella agarivorans]MDZ8118465.1 Gfo/Idh/MocA family oxidoreductase [Pontiella agarivorans]
MKLNRRNGLKAGVAAGTAFSFIPGRVLGANEQVNLAVVGSGGIFKWTLMDIERVANVNLVAFSDVDQSERVTETIKNYADKPLYVDFREMLDKHPEIDAVIVSTPDHTHHYIGAYCMKAGKHVYVQKPLAHNIAECRDFMRLEKETGVVCQMGNQGHSGVGIKIMEQWINARSLGEITELHAWCRQVRSVGDKRPAADPIPETLDWDKWLGPAAKVDYSRWYQPGHWRNWFEFGTGTMGDWFCHNADAPYTLLGLDCPKSVEVAASSGKKKLSFPEHSQVTFVFDHPTTGKELKMHWYSGKQFGPPIPKGMEEDARFKEAWGGSMFVGSKATVLTGPYCRSPRIIPEELHREMAKDLPRYKEKRSGHVQNWINAIRGGEKANSHFDYAGRLTETMHWGNIALHLGRDLRIDPKTRRIIGDREASRMMSWPAPREGWTV